MILTWTTLIGVEEETTVMVDERIAEGDPEVQSMILLNNSNESIYVIQDKGDRTSDVARRHSVSTWDGSVRTGGTNLMLSLQRDGYIGNVGTIFRRAVVVCGATLIEIETTTIRTTRIRQGQRKIRRSASTRAFNRRTVG